MPLTATFTLSTLNTNTGMIVATTAQTQNFKATSIRAAIGLAGLTEASDGPLLYGIAGSGISLAELEAYIESVPNTGQDTPATEQVSRAVQALGAIGLRRETQWIVERVLLPTFREDVGHVFWVYNVGIAMTTGAIVEVRGRYFGRWLA